LALPRSSWSWQHRVRIVYCGEERVFRFSPSKTEDASIMNEILFVKVVHNAKASRDAEASAYIQVLTISAAEEKTTYSLSFFFPLSST